MLGNLVIELTTYNKLGNILDILTSDDASFLEVMK